MHVSEKKYFPFRCSVVPVFFPSYGCSLFSLICIDVDIMVVDQDMAEKAGKKQKLANDGRQARREDLIMKVASLLGPHFTKLK